MPPQDYSFVAGSGLQVGVDLQLRKLLVVEAFAVPAVAVALWHSFAVAKVTMDLYLNSGPAEALSTLMKPLQPTKLDVPL